VKNVLSRIAFLKICCLKNEEKYAFLNCWQWELYRNFTKRLIAFIKFTFIKTYRKFKLIISWIVSNVEVKKNNLYGRVEGLKEGLTTRASHNQVGVHGSGCHKQAFSTAQAQLPLILNLAT